MPWELPVPSFSGDAGIGELVATMREPSYMRLLGKSIATGAGVGLLARRLPPQVALPVVLVAGIYLGLEMAAWMEEEAVKTKGPVLDASAAPVLDLGTDEDPPARVARPSTDEMEIL
jgi:hypothetical protein